MHFQWRIANPTCGPVNRQLIRFSQKPRSNFSDGVYPKKLDAVGERSEQGFACSAQNFARSAQAVAKLARTEAVRADHRLRTDDEAIRAQSTICG
jgi:hypothetical protein